MYCRVARSFVEERKNLYQIYQRTRYCPHKRGLLTKTTSNWESMSNSKHAASISFKQRIRDNFNPKKAQEVKYKSTSKF